jgi:hypothetical protein
LDAAKIRKNKTPRGVPARAAGRGQFFFLGSEEFFQIVEGDETKMGQPDAVPVALPQVICQVPSCCRHFKLRKRYILAAIPQSLRASGFAPGSEGMW